MDTRRIGSLEVTVVGVGCNNFGLRCDAEQTAAVVRAALDCGINFFDTADVYGNRGGSEELLGRAVGKHRDEVIIATKFGMPMGDGGSQQGGSAAWIARAVDDSLRRLGTDRIDLYQLHAPDAATPLAETLGSLDALVRAGKVREIGCSNFGSSLIDEAAAASAAGSIARFASVQNHYNLLERGVEAKVVPACERRGMALLPYFPLASGLLTGKYRAGEAPPPGTRLSLMPAERVDTVMSERNLGIVAALEAYARDRGRTLLELAMSWLVAQPVVASVIAGATRPEQVTANVDAVGWALTSDDLAAIDKITRPAA